MRSEREKCNFFQKSQELAKCILTKALLSTVESHVQGFPTRLTSWGIFNNRLLFSGNFVRGQDLNGEGQSRDRADPPVLSPTREKP